MGQKVFQVDVFADKPFSGNPAAVCILPQEASPEWMLQMAMEMNCSDTAFVLRQDGISQLRFFTPRVEIDLSGHTTLASAFILWQEGYVRPTEEVHFTSKGGKLSVKRTGKWIEMRLPAWKEKSAEAPPDLLKALGLLKPLYVGKNEYDYIVEVESEGLLRSLAPNFFLLEAIPVRGVIVTARSDSTTFDFVSRYFAPAVGVDEDPVTGSAHCCLCPYWSAKLNKKELVGYQASLRGGVVGCHDEGNTVLLKGQAITVMRCELLIT